MHTCRLQWQYAQSGSLRSGCRSEDSCGLLRLQPCADGLPSGCRARASTAVQLNFTMLEASLARSHRSKVYSRERETGFVQPYEARSMYYNNMCEVSQCIR